MGTAHQSLGVASTRFTHPSIPSDLPWFLTIRAICTIDKLLNWPKMA